ncbi:MAG TPA: DEAD/DEAH box helicase family protein, partial [Limnochordales bacterium]
MLAMRDYQQAAVEAVEREFRRGVTRQLIVLPTGTGKTVIFSHVAKRRGGRTLVLAHRTELLDQALAKIQLVWPEARVGRIQGPQDRHRGRDVVVASVPTLARPERLQRLAPEFATIIIDE